MASASGRGGAETSDAASTKSPSIRQKRRIPPRLHVRRVARGSLGIPRVVSRSLGYDLIAGCCAGGFMGMVFPFLIKIARDELGATPAMIAFMSSAFFIGNLLSPIWARQMEGKGKVDLVATVWIVARSLLFLLMLPFSTNALVFVGVISTMQFLATIALPAYTSVMRDIYPDRARGKLMGYVRVAVQICMFIGTLLTGRLLDQGVSFQALFPLAGILGIGAALSFRHVRPYDPAASKAATAKEGASGTTARQFAIDTASILKHNVGFRWFALSVMCYGFGNLMAQPIYGLYQVDKLHISGTQIANLVNFSSVMSIVGAFFWGRFIDRHGSPKTVFWSILLVSLIPIVYLVAGRVETLFFASALWGLGFVGIELSYMASILDYAEPGRAAQYQSLNSLLQGVRGVIAPMVSVSLVHNVGFRNTFWIVLVVMLAGCVMQWVAAWIHDVRARSATAA